jgi:hypothetical protein
METEKNLQQQQRKQMHRLLGT